MALSKTKAEIIEKERAALNIANTASARRAKVVAELAKKNGHPSTAI